VAWDERHDALRGFAEEELAPTVVTDLEDHSSSISGRPGGTGGPPSRWGPIFAAQSAHMYWSHLRFLVAFATHEMTCSPSCSIMRSSIMLHPVRHSPSVHVLPARSPHAWTQTVWGLFGGSSARQPTRASATTRTIRIAREISH